MNSNPLVSIVIPTYNRVNLIGETLTSALTQSYKNIEVIVLDNNSSDKTLEYLERNFHDYSNLFIYKNDTTLPIVENWKKCVGFAKGEYLLILWSDDIIDETFISRTTNYLNNHPNSAFVYTKTKIFKGDNKKIGKSVFKQKEEGELNRDIFIKKSLLDPPLSVPVSPANALFRRPDVVKNLILDIPNNFEIDFKNIGQGNDNLIFLLTLKNYSSFGYINDVLVYFRSHDSSITINSDSLMVNLRYHIAKAYFIDLTNLNIKLINNFNMKYKLLSILVKLKFKKYYGISNLYSKNKNINTNFLFTFILLYRYFINIFYIKDRN